MAMPLLSRKEEEGGEGGDGVEMRRAQRWCVEGKELLHDKR